MGLPWMASVLFGSGFRVFALGSRVVWVLGLGLSALQAESPGLLRTITIAHFRFLLP